VPNVGLFDTVKGWFGGGKAKVQDTVSSHSDTLKGGIDKAGNVIDGKTGGRYRDQVSAAQEKGKDLVDGLAGDRPPEGPGTNGTPTS